LEVAPLNICFLTNSTLIFFKQEQIVLLGYLSGYSKKTVSNLKCQYKFYDDFPRRIKTANTAAAGAVATRPKLSIGVLRIPANLPVNGRQAYPAFVADYFIDYLFGLFGNNISPVIC
jgi:hypothetical protein